MSMICMEIARQCIIRFYFNGSSGNFKAFVKPTGILAFIFFLSGIVRKGFQASPTPLQDDLLDNHDWMALLIAYLFGLSFYVIFHRTLMLTPVKQSKLLENQLHNIGPGLAKGFATILKKAIQDKESEKHVTEYMKKQQIGYYSTLGNGTNSSFMTDHLVLFFPKDLMGYIKKFKETKQKLHKAYSSYSPSQNLVATNSQGLVELDGWNRILKKDSKVLNNAEKLTYTYEVAGQKRTMFNCVISWQAKDRESKNWYFKSFDVKPLENLVDWRYDIKNAAALRGQVVDPEDLNDRVQKQYELFKKCLLEEINKDLGCKDKYYCVTYDDRISDCMATLQMMISKKEHKTLV